jgi:membrane carboxypeptidase/penicillin-binding protein PbpC
LASNPINCRVTLAVLPNAPSLILSRRIKSNYWRKRNRLLLKIVQEGVIDKQTYEPFDRRTFALKTVRI